MAKTQLTIGKLTIPVKTEKVARKQGLPSFSQGCPECHGDIGYVKECKECGHEADNSEIKKKWSDGDEEHIFEKDEIKKVKKSSTSDGMTVQKVVDLQDIDFKTRGMKPYYLAPQEDATKRYALLNEALQESELAVIVKFTPRSRQSLYAVWSNGTGLVATKIAFQDDMKHQEPRDVEVGEDAVEKVTKLLQQEKRNTEHKIVENEQRQEMEDLLYQKAMGEEIVIEQKVEQNEEDSLMEEIEESIEVTE